MRDNADTIARATGATLRAGAGILAASVLTLVALLTLGMVAAYGLVGLAAVAGAAALARHDDKRQQQKHAQRVTARVAHADIVAAGYARRTAQAQAAADAAADALHQHEQHTQTAPTQPPTGRTI